MAKSSIWMRSWRGSNWVDGIFGGLGLQPLLDHFKELPAIEQAQYPKDYASDLQSKIDLDFNYRTHQAEGKGKDPMSLIEMLFEQSPQQANELPQEPKNATDSPTVRSNP